MSRQEKTTKIFTPGEYKRLKTIEINDMLENDVSFLVSNILKLEGGFAWCTGTNVLFDKDAKEITLTRLEKSFLKILIDNKNKIVDYDSIKDVVWKGKDMTAFTMRNVASKLRIKTCYELVKNKSNCGYIIETKEK